MSCTRRKRTTGTGARRKIRNERGVCYSAVFCSSRKETPIAYYQPSLFDDEPAARTPSPRPYSSLDDVTLQELLHLDLDKGHRDPDLKREFDARMSEAFLSFFQNLGPDPNGTRIVLHPGLKKKLRDSAEHLNS